MDDVTYNNILRRTSNIVRQILPGGAIEASDLLSEAFISGNCKTESQYVHEIIRLAGLSKTNYYKRDENKVSEYRVCKTCKDALPAESFRSWYVRGFLIYDSYCRPCKNAYLNEYKKKKRRAVGLRKPGRPRKSK